MRIKTESKQLFHINKKHIIYSVDISSGLTWFHSDPCTLCYLWRFSKRQYQFVWYQVKSFVLFLSLPIVGMYVCRVTFSLLSIHCTHLIHSLLLDTTDTQHMSPDTTSHWVWDTFVQPTVQLVWVCILPPLSGHFSPFHWSLSLYLQHLIPHYNSQVLDHHHFVIYLLRNLYLR